MDLKRILLIILGVLYPIALALIILSIELKLPERMIGTAGAFMGFSHLILIATAYMYAEDNDRSPSRWSLFVFILPFPAALILGCLKPKIWESVSFENENSGVVNYEMPPEIPAGLEEPLEPPSGHSGSGIKAMIEELIEIGRNDGFLSTAPGGNFNEDLHHKKAREIGKKLYDQGGKDLMKDVCKAVHFAVGPVQGRELEYAWNRIGNWYA